MLTGSQIGRAPALLELSGEFCAVGDMSAYDTPAPNLPTIQLRRQDGGVVTISGLTFEECRAAAEGFLQDCTLRLTQGTP